MISYDAYYRKFEAHRNAMENIPDNEIEVLYGLITVDVTKSLPQTIEMVYSGDRTPFILNNMEQLTTKSYKKIRDYFKENGWSVVFSFSKIPPDNTNINLKVKLEKARK